jgi:uncharacterized membrane protein YdjX (TVP38/TMEM64 family)
VRRAAWLRVLALAATLAAAFAAIALTVGHSTADVRDTVSGLGGWAPVLYVLLVTGLSVVLFPYPVLAGAAGLLFGVAEGTALAIAGNLLGASAAFLVARRAGRAPVETLVGTRLEAAMRAVSERGFQAVLLLRVTPGISGAVVNYVCGLTRVGLAPFALATLIGNAPRSYAYVALGGSLGNFGNTQSIVALGLLIGIGLFGVALLARDEQVRNAVRDWRRRRRA